MGYPRRLLGEDEEIVLDLHPHWRRLVLPLLAVPVVVGLAAFAAANVPAGSARDGLTAAVLVVAVVVLLVTSVRPWLRWTTTSYVVTTHRVVIREGIVSRTGRDVPLQRLNDVTFHHGLVERLLFRSGTLTIESAGERGQVVLDDVPRVEDVQSTIYRLAEEDDVRRRRLALED